MKNINLNHAFSAEAPANCPLCPSQDPNDTVLLCRHSLANVIAHSDIPTTTPTQAETKTALSDSPIDGPSVTATELPPPSPMGFAGGTRNGDSESSTLLPAPVLPNKKIPEDSYHLAYIVYFTLGAGFLLPWNAFITAVDYFSYLYPDASVDRVFAVVYMLVGLLFLLLIIAYAYKSDVVVRINAGLALFVLALLVVPVLDAVYIKGRTGIYSGFYVTVAAVGLSGMADALVQGGIIGSAGELPERYMQAVVSGTAASGVLVSFLRILTKAVYPQNPHGLRKSANLYFSVSIVIMGICIVFYNAVHRLPVIKYYNDLKMQAVNEEREERGEMTGCLWRSTLWSIVGRVKWYGFGIALIYVVTLSIFPGYVTEDVHSAILKDWYSILLITAYNVFDLFGKSLTAVYLLENSKIAIGASVARLLFYPLFLGCLHGPKFFRTEIPVTLLTCLLGLTNGYFTSVLMILAPKAVQLQQAEIAGIVVVLFLIIGLAAGSIVAWFWVI
ncbi:equilibrative nucleotide transporter 1 [Malania oleifera]|uniref:equilibrative nucleotide transporter 1 n=1 Tax=Malania oleifera TaxID=397392 RepID=UPI0025ADCF24|nr:equilibrative nucleotide transporter 1 [Malania oleifera]